MKKRKLLKVVRWVLAFWVAFLLCLIWTFPADVLGDKIALEVTKQTHGKVQVEFGALGLGVWSGINAEEVTIVLQDQEEALTRVALGETAVGIAWPSLFVLNPKLRIRTVLGASVLKAWISKAGEARSFEIKVQAKDLRLESLSPFLKGVDFVPPLAGGLSGEVMLALGPARISGVSVPRTDLGSLKVGIKVEQGKARIERFMQQGGDLKLKLSGDVFFGAELGLSSLNVCAQVLAEPAFLQNNISMQALFNLAEMRAMKNGAGYLQFPLRGSLSHPRLSRVMCPN
jgi:type II secretion system protein N